MDTIAVLQQLDQECTSWANHHAHSCNLLASLLNITRQREQTLQQWQQQQQHQSNQSQHSFNNTTFNYKNKALLASTSLQLLIQKQSLEIESVVGQLYETINIFKKVVQALVTLEHQVEYAIQRMDVSRLLDTTNPHCVLSVSSSLNSSGVSGSEPLSSTSIPFRPLSIESTMSTTPNKSTFLLMDTAEISPLEVLDWVSRIRAMYAQELNLKQSQIHPAMTALDRFETLADLQKSWGLQKRIDFGLEQEILERIKAYRRVREFSSRT